MSFLISQNNIAAVNQTKKTAWLKKQMIDIDTKSESLIFECEFFYVRLL